MKKLILFLLISTMLLGQAWRNPDIVPYRRIFNLKTGAEITALGAPDVGWGFVYAKDDKQFYFMDSDSVEYLLSFALTSGIVDSLTLAAAGVKLTAADGVLTIIGLGNGNDENLTFDFDNAAANEVNVASGTGVTGIDFGTIDLKTDYVWAQTFDTDVAAAAVTLSAATLAADGTDANINIAITPKGTGEVDITKVDIDGGAIDGTVIGENSAEDAKFDTVKAVNYSGASDFEIGSAGEDITIDADSIKSDGTTVLFGIDYDDFVDKSAVETITEKWTFSDTLIASKAVKGDDGVILSNETATKATLPSNTSWMYPYDDGASVHLMATKDDNGTETVVKIAEQPDLVNLSSKGAVYSFDGVDDYVNCGDNTNFSFGNGTSDTPLSFVSIFYTTQITNLRLFSKSAGNDEYFLGTSGDGKPLFRLIDNSASDAYIGQLATSALALNKWYVMTGTYDGSGTSAGITLYLDGSLILSSANESGSYIAMENLGDPLYFGRISALYNNIAIAEQVIFNCAITDATERAQIALGNVPAKYQWGSQTELMPNQVDRDFSGASAWADVDLVSGSGAYDETGDLTITAGAAGAGDYCTCPVLSVPTTIGKVYRLKYDYTVAVAGAWTIKDFTGVQTIGTISATATQGILEWTATTTGGLRIVAAANNVSGTFDNFTLTKLGAVAAYLPQNMTASTAYDASSNKLNGTVSSATLLNAKVADAFVNPEIATSDDDVIATVKHSGYDSAGNLDDFVKFETIMQDVTATTEDGGYKISAMVAGTMTNTLEFDGNTGILDIAGALTAASIVSDAQVTATTTVSGATYGSNGSISDAELLTLDDGATTQLLVGGGVGSAPVWTTATGTGAPVRAGSPTFTTQITTPNILITGDIATTGSRANLIWADSVHANWFGGSDFKFGESGSDITFNADTIKGNLVLYADWVNTDNPWADNEVADNISITNISQVGDITATALEINTPLDGALVTLVEFQQLETIGATTVSANQWTALGGLAETLTGAEVSILDGVTVTAVEVNILDGVTGVTAAELSHIGDVTGLIQAQIDLKAPLASPTFTGLVKRSVTATITAATPGGQGDGALTSDINEISVCGTASDAVTLPTAVAGLEIFIINNGAQILEIWPATGDDLGAGVNTATTLAAAANVTFVAFNSVSWEIK